MTQDELKVILDNHAQWLRGQSGGQRANLQYANLQGVDLQGADLQHANLQRADLRGANLQRADLQGADLDFSSGIPLWCGGQDAKIDSRLARQIVAHALAQDCDDPMYAKLREAARNWCQGSHVAKHIHWLRWTPTGDGETK